MLTTATAVTLLTNVLIHPAFPFHIFSEIVAFDKGVQCLKKKDSWKFSYNDTFVVHASQRLLNDPSHKGRSDSKLYWIDQEPPVYLNRASTYPAPTFQLDSCLYACTDCTFPIPFPSCGSEHICTVCHAVNPAAVIKKEVEAGVDKLVQDLDLLSPFASPFVNTGVDQALHAALAVAPHRTRSPARRFACRHCTFDQPVDQPPNMCLVCMRPNYLYEMVSYDPSLIAASAARVCVTRHVLMDSPCAEAVSKYQPVAVAGVVAATVSHPPAGQAELPASSRQLRQATAPPSPPATARLHLTRHEVVDAGPAARVCIARHEPAAHKAIATLGAVPVAKPLSTAKNLSMLLELHCAHDHCSFEAIAKQYKLTLPDPRPQCYACLLAKPRRIAHDKVSTRVTERVLQGVAADAKGPISTPTPEGYKYFFLIVDLFCGYYWTILAKGQDEWKDIWPRFVKQAEAHSGKSLTVSFIITDGHKVHSTRAIRDFNDDRGIRTLTTAPHSQWQDPAERGIQTIVNGARASLIHGGGHSWMWGDAVLHSADSRNRMQPPHRVPGFEGYSRLRIMDQSATLMKEMRTHRSFLSLCFKTMPKPELGSNFNPRATPCIYLRYDSSKKAYKLLTIPNLYVTHSIEVRFVPQAFPLRVTNHLSNHLDKFLSPNADNQLYSSIHGPDNMLRRQQVGPGHAVADPSVAAVPVAVRVPVLPSALPGPGHSSSRGYVPSVTGLLSAASGKPSQPSRPSQSSASVNATTAAVPTFTADQLAARTPRSGPHAMRGEDSVYWIAGIKKDFAIIRDNKCIINTTDKRPPGPAQPPFEQKFKIKHRS